MIIDPPSIFASLEEWVLFRDELIAMQSNDPAVIEHLGIAERMIVNKRAN